MLYQEGGVDMLYDGTNLPFIQSFQETDKYIWVMWNSQAQAAVSGANMPLESVIDDAGCTS